MSDAALAIQCRGLVKRYDAKTLAVDGLDLEVRRGECFGLLGPNGAGKTTTCEILEGLLAPTSGDVEVLGRRWDREEKELRARVGVSLQQTILPDRLTVREIVEMFRSFFASGRDVERVLSSVSLTEKADTWQMRLSGGQKQRLAVACAIVGDPELLFLDEPTTGLDPQSRLQLWEVVSGFKSEGRTVLLTTHYMDEAERLCDRVAVVDKGKVIALGTPHELKQKYVGEEMVEFAATPLPDEKGLTALAGVGGARKTGDGYAVTVTQAHLALPGLLAFLEKSGSKLLRLSTRQATLEDVFVTLTGRNLRD